MSPICFIIGHMAIECFPSRMCPIMLPAPIELLESDPMPAHAPATDIGAVGAVGDIEA